VAFTAEGRVDFRELVKDLASQFKTRIELRQIGDRDEAKTHSGYGVCGRHYCCSSWLDDFPAVSIKMAKEQELPLNPSKITGACGRLLCCLSYENEQYAAAKRDLPRVGDDVILINGKGTIIAHNVLKGTVTLDMGEGQKRQDVAIADLPRKGAPAPVAAPGAPVPAPAQPAHGTPAPSAPRPGNRPAAGRRHRGKGDTRPQ
jgi:cell fate regulator YaaT (PSP1 superfamily)